ncbi:MAG: methylmalonyl-CoA mutase family protein [bacterium]
MTPAQIDTDALARYKAALDSTDQRAPEFRTSSGTKLHAASFDVDIERLPDPQRTDREVPGVYPFTRGIHAAMYRSRLWTMRQYAGFGDADSTNARYRYLLDHGQTGLSVAFDLPTQLGLDSDAPLAAGEVGKTGVAIDSLADMRRLFAGIDLGKVSTSMTINAPASVLLALYVAVADEQGVPRAALRGTIQNDILKEYVARGTYIFPVEPSMYLITDSFRFCNAVLPRWNPISISGYHIREAGSTAAQELAFTFSHAKAYVDAALAAGLDLETFAKRLSFFWNAHNNFLEEVAKFRAARRIWARLMHDTYGATSDEALRCRFHTQTAGSMLTAEEPLNNVIRVTLQGLAAVLGGTQSLHTNGFDEALALPTEEAARIALRTQQIIGVESGVADIVDPLGGAYALEVLTAALEDQVATYFAEVDRRGGPVQCVKEGYFQREIQRSAYQWQRAVESRTQQVVGVNAYLRESTDTSNEQPRNLLKVDPALEAAQIAAVQSFRSSRDQAATDAALGVIRETAKSRGPLIETFIEAVKAGATVGEICDVLREEFGEFTESVTL